MKNETEEMMGNPPEVKLFLIMKNETEEMMGNPPELNTNFDNKNRRNVEVISRNCIGIPPEFKPILIMKNKTEQETVEEMLRQISRLSPQSINRIGVWCLDLLRNRLELSLKELNKKD